MSSNNSSPRRRDISEEGPVGEPKGKANVMGIVGPKIADTASDREPFAGMDERVLEVRSGSNQVGLLCKEKRGRQQKHQ